MAKPIAFKPGVVAQISVSDFQRELGWLRDNLGFEAQYTVDEMGWAEVSTNVENLTIGVNFAEGWKAPAGDGGATLVLAVEDIDVARKSLEARGVAFDGPTNEIPGMVKLATFRDPDGNAFAFSQSLGG